MKKLTAVALLLAVTLTFATSCASTQPIGILMTDVRLPLVTGDAAKATKVGIAESKSLLQEPAAGDSSIEAACKNGGITKIHHVDWEANSMLGIMSTYRCVVYGE